MRINSIDTSQKKLKSTSVCNHALLCVESPGRIIKYSPINPKNRLKSIVVPVLSDLDDEAMYQAFFKKEQMIYDKSLSSDGLRLDFG